MRLLALATLLLIQEETPPPAIEPLAALAKKLDDGAAAFLKDGKFAEAFKPWPVSEDEDKPVGPLRDALKAAGVAKLSALDVEVQLLHFNKDKPCAWLKTLVYLDGADSGFVGFTQSKADNAALLSRTTTFEVLNDFEPLLARAAAELAAAITAKREDSLVFADPDRAARRFGDKILGEKPFREDYRGYIKAGRDAVKAGCAEIRRLDIDGIKPRINNVRFLALAEDGTPLGIVGGKFGLNMDLAFVLHAWWPFKK